MLPAFNIFGWQCTYQLVCRLLMLAILDHRVLVDCRCRQRVQALPMELFHSLQVGLRFPQSLSSCCCLCLQAMEVVPTSTEDSTLAGSQTHASGPHLQILPVFEGGLQLGQGLLPLCLSPFYELV